MAQSIETPRLIRYETPSAFLRAALPFDTWHMNLALGPSLQFFVEAGDVGTTLDQPCLWLAVWTGDALDIVLVRTSLVIGLCAPKQSTSLAPDWLQPRMQLLASALHSLIASGVQPAMTTITGATLLITAFMPLYAALSGIGPEASWVRGMLHSHCPRDRADLQPPKLPERHRISIVELGDPVALLQLAKLLKAFRADLGGPRADNYTLEQGIKDAEAGVRFREFMLYSVQDAEGKEEVAGCVRTGRLTSRHGAVRNVFTLPHYRRQGIAQALTHAAILRLLSEPNPMRQVLATLLPPGAEPDIEDALIFAEKSNMSAQGIYARAGYGFPVRDREEEEGNRWEDCVELGYGDSGH